MGDERNQGGQFGQGQGSQTGQGQQGQDKQKQQQPQQYTTPIDNLLQRGAKATKAEVLKFRVQV